MDDIELTHDEEFQYNHIIWDDSDFVARSPEEQHDSSDAAARLVDLLRARKAIPKIRLDLFSKPELNLAGRGRCPMQILQQNGVTKRDRAFLKYLWYFLHGPKLPTETIDGIVQIMNSDEGTSGEVIRALIAFLCEQTRLHGFTSKEATELEKLAHEIGWGRHADEFRKAVLAAK